MKKPKTVKPFFFKDIDHQQLVDMLNADYPISLKYNTELIDRIHSRYPLISKTQTAAIIMAIFQSFRDLLVLGNILNFNNLFFDTKLLIFKYVRDGILLPSIKIQISTPPPIKNNK